MAGNWINDGRLPTEQPGTVFDTSGGLRMAYSAICAERAEQKDGGVTDKATIVVEAPFSEAELKEHARVAGAILTVVMSGITPGMSLSRKMSAVSDAFSDPDFPRKAVDALAGQES